MSNYKLNDSVARDTHKNMRLKNFRENDSLQAIHIFRILNLFLTLYYSSSLSAKCKNNANVAMDTSFLKGVQ